MIEFRKKLKNFGPLEALVLSSLAYVVIMLIWTASTRSAVVQKANDIKANHKVVVEFINNQVNKCSLNEKDTTSWGDDCNSAWVSSKIVEHILNNIKPKPSLLVDVVDCDPKTDTLVFWHCGLAPISMAKKNTASATVHSNRRKALLHDFAFRPRKITIFRFSKSEN